MNAQEAFNAFLEDHYLICREKDCEPGAIAEMLVEEVLEEDEAEYDKKRLIHEEN